MHQECLEGTQEICFYPRTDSSRSGNNSGVIEYALILAFSGAVFLLAVVPSAVTVIRYLVLPVILLLLYKYDSFLYILFPFSFLDDVIGTYIAGRITLLWFVFIVISFRLLTSRRKSTFSAKELLLITVLFLYFIAVSIFDYGMTSIKTMAFVVFFTIFMNGIRDDTYSLQKLLFCILAASLIPAFNMAFNIIVTDDAIEVGRTGGIGFSDPNYASFICAIGLSAALFYKPAKTKTLMQKRIFLLLTALLLVFAVFRSGSRGGLIAVVFILLLKILFSHGLAKKIKLILLFSLIAFLVIFCILPYTNVESIKPIIMRLEQSWISYANGDIRDLTAGRSYILSKYIDYFSNQSPLRILFGFNTVGSQTLFSKVGINHVTHNLYMDYLLAFGIVGSIVMFYLYAVSIVVHWKMYKQSNSETYIAIISIKLIGLVTGISLAMVQVYPWWIICIL